MPAAKKNKKVITTTPEELAKLLKQYGFVTRKEVKNIILQEVYRLTKRNYMVLSKHLKELNLLLKRKFLGKSRYFVANDPYSGERNLN